MRTETSQEVQGESAGGDRELFTLLGLESGHEAVYRAMRAQPEWGVAQLAEHLGTPAEAIRAALDALFELRLLRESFERPGTLRAVSPQAGLQALLDRQRDDLLVQQKRIIEQQTALGHLVGRFSSSEEESAPDAEQLIGLDAVQERLERLAEETRSQVLTFMPGGAQSEAALAAARRNDARLLARGIRVRTIGLDSVRQDGPTLAYARWLSGHGAEYRTAASLPPRMILVDDHAALVPLDPKQSRLGAVYVTRPGVVAALHALFDQVWQLSTPLGVDSRPEADGLSETESELLRLAGEGLTDEAVAARMHISARTARRTMAGLMERLGARSRFEAGLKAAQRGWL